MSRNDNDISAFIESFGKLSSVLQKAASEQDSFMSWKVRISKTPEEAILQAKVDAARKHMEIPGDGNIDDSVINKYIDNIIEDHL